MEVQDGIRKSNTHQSKVVGTKDKSRLVTMASHLNLNDRLLQVKLDQLFQPPHADGLLAALRIAHDQLELGRVPKLKIKAG